MSMNAASFHRTYLVMNTVLLLKFIAKKGDTPDEIIEGYFLRRVKNPCRAKEDPIQLSVEGVTCLS